MCHGRESRHNSEYQWAIVLNIVTFSIAASQLAARNGTIEFCMLNDWKNCSAFFTTPWAISLVAGLVSIVANVNFYYQFYHKKSVSSFRLVTANTLCLAFWLPAVVVGFLPIKPERSTGAFRWVFELAKGVGELGIGSLWSPYSEIQVFPHYGVAGAIFVVFSFSWTAIVWLLAIYRTYIPKSDIKDEENRPVPSPPSPGEPRESIQMETYHATSAPRAEHVEAGPSQDRITVRRSERVQR